MRMLICLARYRLVRESVFSVVNALLRRALALALRARGATMRSEPFEGDAVVRCRVEMGLNTEELATVLGVHRTTLYTWEAEGRDVRPRIQRPASAGATVLAWLLTLSSTERAVEGKNVRRFLARDEVYLAQGSLFMRMARALEGVRRQA